MLGCLLQLCIISILICAASWLEYSTYGELEDLSGIFEPSVPQAPAGYSSVSPGMHPSVIHPSDVDDADEQPKGEEEGELSEPQVPLITLHDNLHPVYVHVHGYPNFNDGGRYIDLV